MSRSTAAGFLVALQSPQVFAAWAAVAKDDYNAVSSFIASTLGLAVAPSPQQLVEIEESMKEMIDGDPGVRAPRAVGFAFVAQSVTKDRPRQAPFAGMCYFQHASATLTDDQRRAVAAGFIAALSSPAVFAACAEIPKDDPKAVGEFVQRTMNLAQPPTAADLNAIHEIVGEMMATQSESPDVRAPRHVGFAFVAQKNDASISDADLRELLELARLTAD